jgi:hypothetical protein
VRLFFAIRSTDNILALHRNIAMREGLHELSAKGREPKAERDNGTTGPPAFAEATAWQAGQRDDGRMAEKLGAGS